MQSKTIPIFATGVTASDSDEVGHAVSKATAAGTTFITILAPEWQYLSPFLQDQMSDLFLSKNFDPFTLNEIIIEVGP